jgi:hypothetical protein
MIGALGGMDELVRSAARLDIELERSATRAMLQRVLSRKIKPFFLQRVKGKGAFAGHPTQECKENGSLLVRTRTRTVVWLLSSCAGSPS